MILNPSIRAAGFANFFPFRSVIAPMRNGTNSMNWRSARLPETGKFLIALRKNDSMRHRRGIPGVKTGIRIGRTQTTQTARDRMRVRRKANRRKPGIRKDEVMGGHQGGSIDVPRDRLERIRGTAARAVPGVAEREAAVQEVVVPEAVQLPDSKSQILSSKKTATTVAVFHAGRFSLPVRLAGARGIFLCFPSVWLRAASRVRHARFRSPGRLGAPCAACFAGLAPQLLPGPTLRSSDP